MRDSAVFYRTFYTSITQLDKELRLELYEAIFELSFNLNKVNNLSGISKAFFEVIAPQIEANIRKWENGKKPKRSQREAKDKPNESKEEAKDKQKISKHEANVDVYVNVDDNVNNNNNYKDNCAREENEGPDTKLHRLPDDVKNGSAVLPMPKRGGFTMRVHESQLSDFLKFDCLSEENNEGQSEEERIEILNNYENIVDNAKLSSIEKTKSMTELANNFLGVAKKDYQAEKMKLPEEWEIINFECLHSIGFKKQHVRQLFEKNMISPADIQKSLIAFSEHLKDPDKKQYSDPLSVIIGALLKGNEFTYAKTAISKKEQPLETKRKYDYLEEQREKEKRLKKENEEKISKELAPRREACRKWFDSFDEKNIIPISMFSHIKNIREAEIFKYYEENIEN